jgi:hypothetical protein
MIAPGSYTLIESLRAKRRKTAPITLIEAVPANDCADVKGDHLDGWFRIRYTNDRSTYPTERSWIVTADQLVPR